LDIKEELPYKWTAAFMAKFIKKRYGEDLFTVIAFIGKDEKDGFIVLEIPRDIFQPQCKKFTTVMDPFWLQV